MPETTPATAQYRPAPASLARGPERVLVYRAGGELLPNVRLLSIHQREFMPPAARYRYVLDDHAIFRRPGDPSRIEQCFPIGAKGPGIVATDDRLIAARVMADGSRQVLHDGFATDVQPDADPDSRSITFGAIDAVARDADSPLGGAIVRDTEGAATRPDADAYKDPAKVQDVRTGLHAVFNPQGKPNATAKDRDSGRAPNFYPVFVEPDAEDARHWTLAMAAKYCLLSRRPTGAGAEVFYDFDTLDFLDDMLVAYKPVEEGGAVDPDDPSTYVAEPIVCQDADVTFDTPLEAVRRLIEPHGFAWRVLVSTKSDGTARHRIDFYRKDDRKGIVHLDLQPEGSDLDPARSRVNAYGLARDVRGIVNRWGVISRPRLYEARFVLRPSFRIDPDDLGHLDVYVKSNGAHRGFERAYRTFGAGEGGDERWNFATSSMVRPFVDLRELFDPDSEASDPRRYVRRRRKPIRKLLTLDALKRPLEAQLHVSTDYDGNALPALWDPGATPLPPSTRKGGTWQRVVSDKWRLLDDRIGIELTMDDPQNWSIGDCREAGMPFPGGAINVPKCLLLRQPIPAIPAAVGPKYPLFWLGLTCVIEGDAGIEEFAERRDRSATIFRVTRYEDAPEFQGPDVISLRSPLIPAPDGNASPAAVVARDDTDDARAVLEGRRAASELGTFAGSFTLPYFTGAIEIGHKVADVRGIDLSLNTAGGIEGGEKPVYPRVVGLDSTFDGPPSVVIHLSDDRAEFVRAARYVGGDDADALAYRED